MAFTSKVGSLLRQAITKPAGTNAFVPTHSVYNAVRSMSSSKIFVGGLNYLTDDQSLRQAFTDFGEVTEAKVIVDRVSGRSRGFGFVSFTSCEEASAALSRMDGQCQLRFQGLAQELQGRTIRVNYATERTGGGGFRGGYAGGGGYGDSGYGDTSGGFGGNSGGYVGDGQGNDFGRGRASDVSRDNYRDEDGDNAGSSSKGY